MTGLTLHWKFNTKKAQTLNLPPPTQVLKPFPVARRWALRVTDEVHLTQSIN
jgi:hypothetical protein